MQYKIRSKRNVTWPTLNCGMEDGMGHPKPISWFCEYGDWNPITTAALAIAANRAVQHVSNSQVCAILKNAHRPKFEKMVKVKSNSSPFKPFLP